MATRVGGRIDSTRPFDAGTLRRPTQRTTVHVAPDLVPSARIADADRPTQLDCFASRFADPSRRTKNNKTHSHRLGTRQGYSVANAPGECDIGPLSVVRVGIDIWLKASAAHVVYDFAPVHALVAGVAAPAGPLWLLLRPMRSLRWGSFNRVSERKVKASAAVTVGTVPNTNTT